MNLRMKIMKVIKERPYFDPHSAPKGINKINFFDRILRDIFWYTLEYILGFQEKFNKRVRRDPFSLEYIPNHYKTQEMCNKAVKAGPCLLKFVPACFRAYCFKVVQKERLKRS